MNRRSFLAGTAACAIAAATEAPGSIPTTPIHHGDWRGVTERSYEAYIRHHVRHIATCCGLSYDEVAEAEKESLDHWLEMMAPSRLGFSQWQADALERMANPAAYGLREGVIEMPPRVGWTLAVNLDEFPYRFSRRP